MGTISYMAFIVFFIVIPCMLSYEVGRNFVLRSENTKRIEGKKE